MIRIIIIIVLLLLLLLIIIIMIIIINTYEVIHYNWTEQWPITSTLIINETKHDGSIEWVTW